MRKFKYIGREEDYFNSFKYGQIYNEEYKSEFVDSSVKILSTYNPEYWENVGDEQISPDPVNPQHYKNGDVECIDAIKSAVVGKDGFAGYLTGNLLKYVWRYENKGKVEDLKKGLWYLNKLIDYENDKGST